MVELLVIISPTEKNIDDQKFNVEMRCKSIYNSKNYSYTCINVLPSLLLTTNEVITNSNHAANTAASTGPICRRELGYQQCGRQSEPSGTPQS
jgi:hypothetical protein